LAAKKLGQKIVAEAARDQNEVYKFIQMFTKLVDLPQDYADMVAYYADGFDYVNGFTEEKLVERLDRFHEKFASPQIILEKMVKLLNSEESLLSSYKYISVGDESLPDDLRFTFQYRYIFRHGILPLVDLFKDREKGIVYMGVSLVDWAPYDGQNGDASSFLNHDRLHAYTQKFYDRKTFIEFNAKLLEQQRRLKHLTNEFLTRRVEEYLAIAEKDFRLAVEATFFAILHEQSRDYPVGCHHDLEKPAKIIFYSEAIKRYAEKGWLGPEYKNIPQDNYDKALQWVRDRAKVDFDELKSKFFGLNR
jgi:hypothetical protein